MADERIPILYLAPWIDLGGSDKGTIDWFKHIDRSRWAPSLITTQPSPNRWLGQVEPYAEEVWELPDLMPGASFPEFILGFIENRGVRLVHIMNSRLGFDLLPDMACLPEPPAVVAQMHAEEPNQAGYVRYATRRYGNLIDAFSVTSEHLKKIVVGYEIAPSRVEVILSGVDGEREFNPAQIEPLPLDGDTLPRILWPGRLVEQKDPMLTLDVLARARERGGEFILDVVGDGHMKPALQERATALGVAEMIRWHPPSQEMPRWYRSTDLLLMTSVYEGVPYVIYESLAMGVPIIAPALPGNVEFMDGDSGVLVEPRDDVDLYAEAVVELLGDRERRQRMGERSRQRMLAEFSLEEMGRRHDELYERLLRTRPASSRWRGEELFGVDGTSGAAEDAAAKQALTLPRDPAPPRTVGVIVPCYRHGIFLEECVASIKAQTHRAERIVIVDDGSDDAETITALARIEDDPDLTVVRLGSNRGPSAARNRGLQLLETSYAISIDADDRLLPDALERMLAQLETAPEDVGFVYPHAQHFGNRSDFVHLPAYNLWLLMQENYCPAPALFDRRLFEGTGIGYPEEIVVGHEDWDLILQLAEREVRGVHADGPTFLYRRQGFSRVNAVDYGPHAFHEAIERRHPALYGNRDAIKARWAPALSLVLLGDEEVWSDARAGLAEQTCRDFEVLAEDDLQAGIGKARGHWICLLTPGLETMLETPCLVEQLLYGFVSHDGVAAIILGHLPGGNHHALAQLDDDERLSATPLGVVFERPPEAPLPSIELSEDPLADLAVAFQINGSVQWRAATSLEEDASGANNWAVPSSRLNVNYDRSGDRSEVAMRDAVAHQPPRLPELTAGTVRRWDTSKAWMPPGTQPLCRHIEIDGERRIVSNDPEPPTGYELEFELGAPHTHAAPGTRRLVQAAEDFELSDEQNELGKDRHAYGFVEQQPLPLLEHLELRRAPETGQPVLVAGPDDPLFDLAEPVGSLGWIEPQPILPRRDLLHIGPWGVDRLWRYHDPAAWRHRYTTDLSLGGAGATALGSLFRDPAGDLVALRLRRDGRLASDMARPGRASRDPRKIGGWIGAPMKAAGQGRARAAASRLRHLATHPGARRRTETGGDVLGWMRTVDSPGCSPLLSSTHPVTGDQLATCSVKEALAHGYLPDGVLGYILDAGSDRGR
jgi:glycosyltransferase involved in cell wall biosynthesis